MTIAAEALTANAASLRLADIGSTPVRRSLKIAPVSHAAAQYAVTRWHYSGCMPVPPVIRFGVWEDGEFIGVVLFSRGGAPQLHVPFGIDRLQICELTRVALTRHAHPVTQIVAECVRRLRANSPGLRLIVSFADPAHGHHGGIYQAGNWLYVGDTAPTFVYRDPASGKTLHSRVVSASGFKRQFGYLKRVPKIGDCEPIRLPGKHRYALPLDRAMRRQLLKIAQTPPERVR